jgi:hypothetical protein
VNCPARPSAVYRVVAAAGRFACEIAEQQWRLFLQATAVAHQPGVLYYKRNSEGIILNIDTGPEWKRYPFLFLPALALALIVLSFWKKLTGLYLAFLVLVSLSLIWVAIWTKDHHSAGGAWYSYRTSWPVVLGWGAIVFSAAIKFARARSI